MMGDGVIDFASISRWVAATGYDGPIEVEIFNAEIWAADADTVVATMKQRFAELVQPFLVGAAVDA
jgi:sugar phosphate isomerase/epimerase